MLFSSLVFLYAFLPISLIGYYLMPSKFKNAFLFFISMVFFAWGGASYSLILVFSISFNFFIGKLIESRQKQKFWLGLGVIINLIFLIAFKYTNFIVENVNAVFGWVHISVIYNPSILLPIGISFYTFQAISYLVDVYRKTCESQKNIINLGLYISLFPQLIAGPIVRYYDIQQQIKYRKHSLSDIASGIERFVLGFAKKVLIANSMGYVADEVFALSTDSINAPLAWIGIIAYTLQIYYDFAGYSDMAIGLARMFGFKLLENFDYPYISKSIKEFWRRWHISLSNWFRDYLYIPLGGNRLGNSRTIFNLVVVFFVTGFWHGASWNFLLWGLIHGLFLVLERKRFGQFLEGLPSVLKSTYLLFVVVVAWVMFRSESLTYGIEYYKSMFGLSKAEPNFFLLSKLITNDVIVVFIVALMGAFGVFEMIYKWIVNQKIMGLSFSSKTASALKGMVFFAFMLFVLLYGTGNLVLGAYNPFIYFRF